MKQLYLICRLNPKDKLTVIQKVTADELKQIELNLSLAKKYNKDIGELFKLKGNTKEVSETWFNAREEFAKIAGLPPIDEKPSPTHDYISKYDTTIVIPYTKILE